MNENRIPFIMGSSDGPILYIFNMEENALAFAADTGLLEFGVCKVPDASTLYEILTNALAGFTGEFWFNERLSGTHAIQFLGHIPAGAFFEVLKSHADAEGKAGQN